MKALWELRTLLVICINYYAITKSCNREGKYKYVQEGGNAQVDHQRICTDDAQIPVFDGNPLTSWQRWNMMVLILNGCGIFTGLVWVPRSQMLTMYRVYAEDVYCVPRLICIFWAKYHLCWWSSSWKRKASILAKLYSPATYIGAAGIRSSVGHLMRELFKQSGAFVYINWLLSMDSGCSGFGIFRKSDDYLVPRLFQSEPETLATQ